MKKIKLEQYISSQTQFSRRQIRDLLNNQRIYLNGNRVTQLSMLITPKKDIVKIDDKKIKLQTEFLYYKFNKPKDVISTIEDPSGRVCLKQYLEKMPEQLFPIGRLDRQTTGLLLFTNDGQFANRILHPKFEKVKVYKVSLDQPLTKRHTARLEDGFFLEDGPVTFDKLVHIEKNSYLVSIHEGRNRVIRRSFLHFGYTVKQLHRLSIGGIQLGTVKPGQFKRLTKAELQI